MAKTAFVQVIDGAFRLEISRVGTAKLEGIVYICSESYDTECVAVLHKTFLYCDGMITGVSTFEDAPFVMEAKKLYYFSGIPFGPKSCILDHLEEAANSPSELEYVDVITSDCPEIYIEDDPLLRDLANLVAGKQLSDGEYGDWCAANKVRLHA